jgi:hypothetical protein
VSDEVVFRTLKEPGKPFMIFRRDGTIEIGPGLSEEYATRKVAYMIGAEFSGFVQQAYDRGKKDGRDDVLAVMRHMIKTGAL